MGVVYEAIEKSLRRTVALKVLPEDVTRDPQRRARFIREARAAAAVTHPTLLTIFQVGSVDERVYIAMELVRGRSLRDVLAAGPLPVAEARRIGIDIASGLGRAHAAGIVHRDVKPDNVMLSHDGMVKVLDFGIARLAVGSPLAAVEDASTGAGTFVRGALTAEGSLIGTPGYMAPEQSTGGAVDARADVFALGATMYEMLVGLRAFDGHTPIDVLIASARDPFVPIASVRPDVPPALAAIVERCLAKQPADRYPDGDALASALRALATTAPAGPALAMDTLGGAPAPAAIAQTAPPAAPVSAATPVAAPVAPRPARSRALVLGVSVVVLGGLAAFALTRSSDGTSPDGPPVDAVVSSADALPDDTPEVEAAAVGPHLRGDDHAVVGCVVFESAGADEPSGWLGAAAADLVCNRLAVLLGGTNEDTRVPAELLALPRMPTDDLPLDPYAAPDARARSIEAAKKLGPRWVDGRVEVTAQGLAIDVRVVQDDRVLASAHGEARHLTRAVSQAIERLVVDRAIEPASAPAPAVGWWAGASTIPAALAVYDFHLATMLRLDIAEALARVEARAADLRPEVLPILRVAADPSKASEIGKALPPPDDTNDLGRYWSSGVRITFGTDAERAAEADRLAALRAGLTDPLVLAVTTNSEAGIRLGLGQVDRTRELVLGLVERHPRAADWRLLSWVAWQTPWAAASSRMNGVWAPADPDAWAQIEANLKDPPPEERLAFYLRAVLLAPDVPMWNVHLTRLFIRAGQPVRARSFAARMAGAGPERAGTAELMLAIVEGSEGALGSAAARARKVLLNLEEFGVVEEAHPELVHTASNLARIVGPIEELGDAFAQRFVLVDPPRLARKMMAPAHAADGCAEASPAIAKACHERLRALLAQGFFTEGHPAAADTSFTIAERFAAGDMAGVVAAYRPLLVKLVPNGYAPRAFDAMGDPETASRLDQASMVWASLYHGATLGHVREARRALARKDSAAARAFAQTVIDAWGVADVPVPAVAEMKALIASLPPTVAP
ncbi:MAG: serine/threonine protein kinase [Deltaproteobacteria bacterium]|nr:serine/threonine protein kinase [Deltaproteobacteria bacterium]